LSAPAAATELYRAYSRSYATEANRRRIAFYVDLTFAAAGLALTAITLADAAEPLVDFFSTWLPISALPWLVLREIDLVAVDKRHRLEAVNIQEQFDLCFWKGSTWPQHWNSLLAGQPVPDRTIKQLAAANATLQFANDYWVDTRGLPENDAALFRIEQTAAWGAVGHRRYASLNRRPAIAGVIAVCIAALILDLSARHAAVMLFAVAPFLVGRIQSARDHDALADRRERLERHIQAALDPRAPRSDVDVRGAQDEVYRMRIEHRRIPSWLYDRHVDGDRATIDRAIDDRVAWYRAEM
jgi:hypothetical protein